MHMHVSWTGIVGPLQEGGGEAAARAEWSNVRAFL